MKDLLIGLAKSKISKIAEKSGRSESEVLSAIEEGKNGGYNMARQLGLTKDVARQIYDKFGYLADRVPLVGRALLDSEFAKILPNLEDGPQAASPNGANRGARRTEAKKAKAFDKSKYF